MKYYQKKKKKKTPHQIINNTVAHLAHDSNSVGYCQLNNKCDLEYNVGEDPLGDHCVQVWLNSHKYSRRSSDSCELWKGGSMTDAINAKSSLILWLDELINSYSMKEKKKYKCVCVSSSIALYDCVCVCVCEIDAKFPPN